jgi:hypothetical protein
MELKEVQEFIKSNAEKPEVQNYIKGFITPDGVKSFIDSDEGQKLIQPKLDQYFTKGLETWKTNNLTKIVDEQVNKVVLEKYPKETEEQKRLHKLETDLMNETSKRQKAEMLMTATSEASAKGLPATLVKYFVGNDLDSTKAALLDYEQAWKNAMKTEIDKVFKQYGRLPDKGSPDPAGLFTKADVEKMSQSEVQVNMKKIHESMKHW